MWPFKRRPDPGTDKSKVALRSAEETLQNVQERHNEVIEVASSLRDIRTRNHFGEHLARIMSKGA